MQTRHSKNNPSFFTITFVNSPTVISRLRLMKLKVENILYKQIPTWWNLSPNSYSFLLKTNLFVIELQIDFLPFIRRLLCGDN